MFILFIHAKSVPKNKRLKIRDFQSFLTLHKCLASGKADRPALILSGERPKHCGNLRIFCGIP